jgi:endonuclease/exonuclease/phosphatase family metal-dependent hydrolase
MQRFGAALLGVALAASLWAAPAAAHGRQVTVMSRNLYIGANLDPLFGATTLPQLIGAATTVFLESQATRFPERAQAIADEVAATRPDVIGLQDSELPTALGFDARATDRDVILVNADRRPKVKVTAAAGSNYAARLVVPTPAGALPFPRGWTSIDVKLGGERFRVVNTHLEVPGSPVQVLQGQELLAGPAATTLPTLLIGDYNSRADGTGTPTYGMLRAAGFDDAWSDVHPGDPGLTCCWESHLLSPTPPFDERIDLVLHRGGFEALSADIVGDDPVADRTPSGLFHSDHAGVVATLRLP